MSSPLEVPKLERKLKYALAEWLNATTSHGIPNIADSARPLIIRLMWFVFFLASFGYCVYVCVATIVEYAKYEVQISVEITNEFPAEYPAITICNINAFNEERASVYLQNTPIAQYLGAYKCVNLEDRDELLKCLNSSTTDSVLDTLVDNLKRYIANDRSVDSFRTYYGFNLDSDMLISCSFNDIECGAVNFTLQWNNEYGNCYTFNDGKTGNVLTISNTGSFHGLQMELALSPPDKETIFSYKNGLRVLVHNKSAIPFTLSTGINIPTGFETYIGVSRTQRSVLDSPYSDCLASLKSFSTYSERIFGFFRDLNVNYYDQDFCYSLCYQDQLIDECSCADLVTPAIRGAQYCADEEVFCLFDFKKKFFTANTNELCEGVCKQQCEKTEYNLASSRSRYPTYNYMRLLKSNNYSSAYLPASEADYKSFARQSLVKLKVNYDQLYYTNINDEPMTLFENFLGDVGGQLGLFIGLSILSFVELLELSIGFISICIDHRKMKKYR